MRGTCSTVSVVLVVELADELGFTTAQALDLCDRAGIPVADGSSVLTAADVTAVRHLMANPSAAAAAPMAAPMATPLSSFAASVPLPPAPDARTDAAVPVATAVPSYRPERKPIDPSAVGAIIFALLPLATLYLGFRGHVLFVKRQGMSWWIPLLYTGWIFVVPTFICAANARQNAHRPLHPKRGASLAFVATFVVVMTASVATAWDFTHTGDESFQTDLDAAVNDAKQGKGAFGASTTAPSATPSTLAGGAPTSDEAAGQPVTTLVPGDCVDAKTVRGPSPIITDPLTASCFEGHDAQVIDSYTIAELEAESGAVIPSDGPLPASAVFTTAITKACLPYFTTIANKMMEASLLTMIFVLPSEAAWAAGDRDVACALGTRTGQPIEGPAPLH